MNLIARRKIGEAAEALVTHAYASSGDAKALKSHLKKLNEESQ